MLLAMMFTCKSSSSKLQAACRTSWRLSPRRSTCTQCLVQLCIFALLVRLRVGGSVLEQLTAARMPLLQLAATHHMREQGIDIWLDDILVILSNAFPAIQQFQGYLHGIQTETFGSTHQWRAIGAHLLHPLLLTTSWGVSCHGDMLRYVQELAPSTILAYLKVVVT